MQTAAFVPTRTHVGSTRVPGRRAVCRCALPHSQPSSKELQTAAASLALSTAFLTAGPVGMAFAEEAAPAAEAAAAAAAAGGFNPVEVGIVIAPAVLYGLFNIYRSQVDKRAKLSDFLLAVGTLAVVGNILSIIIYKKRFF